MQYLQYLQYLPRLGAAGLALCFTAACSDGNPLSPGIAPTAASSSIAASCSDELDALRAAIMAATFTPSKQGTTAESSLLAKVDAAQAKLEAGKTADAILKLEDVRSTVVVLMTPDANGKVKLVEAEGVSIGTAIDAAEACIEAEPTTPA